MTGRARVLNVRDLVLFTVSGVVIIDQLASSASIGPSAIGWWIVTLALFALPYALITAELGTTWPAQGGIYVWIREAFGDRWGARATWYYWIQLAIWIPSVAILAASIMSQLLLPDMGMAAQAQLAVLFIIAVTVFSILKTDAGKWLPNLGALIKVIVMMVIGSVGAVLIVNGESANELTLQSMAPSYVGAIDFLPIIVFNLIGFELIAAAGDEIKRPRQAIPTAILVSLLLIGGIYIFATLGMLAVLPADRITVDTGIIETLKATLGEKGGGEILVLVLGLGVVFCLLTNMVTWAMAVNRSMQQAAIDGVMPRLFSIEHARFQSPLMACLVMAGLSIVCLAIYYLIATSVADLFWTLIAFSSLIFFIPYLLMFAAFVRLRYTRADVPRPFRLAGGLPGAWLCSGVCVAFILQAMMLFVIVPGQSVDWVYVLSILGGCTVALTVGELIVGSRNIARQAVHD